jgi:hypothetical protein
MQRRQFIYALLLTVVFLAAANAAIHRVSDHSPARVQVKVVEHTTGANCLVIGNSLLYSGFNAAAFDQAAAKLNVSTDAVNGSVGATYPVEHLLMLRLALRSNPHPAVVIYGFFDFQLTDPPWVSSEDLMGNRNIGIFLEPRIAERYYLMDPATRIKFTLLHDLPMYVERGNPYGRVELMRRRIKEIGLAPSAIDPTGNRNFAELESSSPNAFIRKCHEAVEGKVPLASPVQEIIRESRAAGARVIVVEMPLPATHLDNFYNLQGWSVYEPYARNLVNAEGAEFLDASHWMLSPDDFADRLHLTPRAAEEFSAKLADAIYRSPSAEK